MLAETLNDKSSIKSTFVFIREIFGVLVKAERNSSNISALEIVTLRSSKSSVNRGRQRRFNKYRVMATSEHVVAALSREHSHGLKQIWSEDGKIEFSSITEHL